MFTWIPIYQEIARSVLTFEERQGDLTALLKRMRESGLPVIPLADKGAGGEELELTEIDPFTFFASFNRGQRDDNRRAILGELKREWGLESEVPTDFDGIPLVHPMQSWFFLYAANRGPEDIPNLWRLARETVGKSPDEFDRGVLDACLTVKMGSLYKLTMGMFWLNPREYLAVDQRNRRFFEQHGIRLAGKTADAYFALLGQVVEKLGRDFPSISRSAYLSTGGGQGGGGEEADTRYWTLSAGEGGECWQDFLGEEIIAIGWSELGDLGQYDSREEIRDRLAALGGGEGSRKNVTLACWQFYREMKPGDFVFAKQGGRQLLGVGRVTGEYEHRPERPDYRNVRAVEWLATGPWALPEDARTATKTLTDISRFKDALARLSAITGVPLTEGGSPPPPEPEGRRRHWWLNANPKIWDFQDAAIGGTQIYTSHNERGNKRQKYRYFGEVKPGDLLIGYVTSPQKEIVAVCEITKGLHESAAGEGIEFKKVEQLKNPVTYEELKNTIALAKSEPLVNNQGSLFALTEEEFDIIRAAVDEKNPAVQPSPLEPYTKEKALSEIFLSEEELDLVLSRLRRKKNVILQGPPGVGKTFVARRLAYLMMGVKDKSRVQAIQFHQSYSYEDFIQGYRPNDEGRFSIRQGVFYEFCRRAQRDSGREYFFIIDEINRGNLSKIFGELLMLIESDKRKPEHGMPLTYASDPEARFYVPDNLYLIGMMNTADRSLSLVDYALRRRFAFVTLRPQFESDKFAESLRRAGAPEPLVARIRERMAELNRAIAEDERNLGPGYQIGHSYFCPDGEAADEAWFREVVDSEIAPLLEEYWVDSPAKVKEHVSRLLS
jgi:5-methylcytosine-specific restriction protein B